jgi:hypothetical protein
MNSLPLIHHHLFVAAIGSEDRGHHKPNRAAECPVEQGNRVRVVKLDVLESPRPMQAGTFRMLQASVNPAEG